MLAQKKFVNIDDCFEYSSRPKSSRKVYILSAWAPLMKTAKKSRLQLASRNSMEVSAVISLRLAVGQPLVGGECWWCLALWQANFCVQCLSADTSKNILSKEKTTTVVSPSSIATTGATKEARTMVVMKCELQAPDSDKKNEAPFLTVWTVRLLTIMEEFLKTKMTVVEISRIGTNNSVKVVLQTVIAQGMVGTVCSVFPSLM